jgi:hypothetical protein
VTPAVVVVGPSVNANASLFFAAATPTSGVALTLLTNALDVPRRVLLTYGNEASGRTMLLTGTDRYGNPISETLVVPSGGAGTVNSQQDFKTLTSALPLGGGWTANATLGTSGVISSEWKVVDQQVTPTNLGIGVVTVGTVNYTIEYTYDNLNNLPPLPVTKIPTVFSHATIVNKTGNFDGFFNAPIWAWRLTLNSFTNPGKATATGIQAGSSQGGAV